ncbi:hypothetical protein [Limnohabitans sp. 2KL-17]|uniref:hypothetical protein n=1 Tax=Limnohabitans sp. 2KL-17 TaxID=1100704 RepID=UPI001304EB6B|nr:hypothetical protein [Limnohabitans sp. 2KL-17]
MPVLSSAYVTSWVRPAIDKEQFLDGRIAEPIKGGWYFVWSAMDTGILAVVEHQHRNFDRRQVLPGQRTGLLVADDTRSQHQPGNVAPNMDGGCCG